MLYIGIDPGQSGGIAVVSTDGGWRSTCKMPESDQGVLDYLQMVRDGLGEASCPIKAALEFVRAMPKQGVSSTFKFGWGYGGLRMALAACQIPFEEVTPAKWQAALGCRSGGDKNVTKRKAQELFPTARVTHAIADALLLAEWLRRRDLGIR